MRHLKSFVPLLTSCAKKKNSVPMRYDPTYAESLIERCRWTLAKTYPSIPHEYIVRGKCELTDEEFVYLVNAQREYGKVEKWHRYEFPYLYVGKYKYWTMGERIEETIIINRQRVEKNSEDVCDARLLINEFIKLGRSIFLRNQTLEALNYDEQIRVRRVASLLKAFTGMSSIGDYEIVEQYMFKMDDRLLEGSPMTEEAVENAKKQLVWAAYPSRIEKSVSKLLESDIERAELICLFIKRLEKCRRIVSQCDVNGTLPDTIESKVANGLYSPVLNYLHDKLLDIIILLLGEKFEKKIPMQVMLDVYNYPRETDKELNDGIVGYMN